jgi:AcrR family transcriptional regulator
MFTKMKKRKYAKKRRAEQQEQTRERIVEAAVALHEELGPRDTTITAVAERAGVQRLTVYRHFPDDAALFRACSSHWIALHPLPEIHDWSNKIGAEVRSLAALQMLYRYYRRTEAMWTSVYRDADEIPALQPVMAAIHDHMLGIRNDLLAAWRPAASRRRELTVTLDHCLRFTTWKSLQQDGLGDRAMAQLALRWARAVRS